MKPLVFFSLALPFSPLVLAPAVRAADPPPTKVEAAATPIPLVITSSTHGEAFINDFSHDQAKFAPYAVPNGLPSGARMALDGGALKIVNTHAGSFGVTTGLPAFDALKFSHLSFDYRMQPSVKVNLFFRINGKYHGVVFSGPDRVRAGSIKLGNIADVQTDDKWHHADLPLRAWMQKMYPTEDKLIVDDLIIGNWDNEGYLVAGFGGNPVGATYYLDNFSLSGPRSTAAEAKFALQTAEATDAKAKLTYSLDDGEYQPLNEKTLSLKTPDGPHLLSVLRTVEGDEAFRASYPFVMSAAAPQVGTPRLSGDTLHIPLETSAGLDLTTLQLKVDDQTFKRDASTVKLDGDDLQLAAGAAGFRWQDGQEIALNLEGLKDSLGREVDKKSVPLKVDYAQMKALPPLPLVKFADGREVWNDGDFENNAGGWVPTGDGAALIDRDNSTKASGDYSLRFTSPSNGPQFRANLNLKSNDIGKYPILSFDYRVPPDLRIDFLVSFDNQNWKIGFTDTDNPWPALGTIPNVQADNQWHHAEVNLFEWMQKARPQAANYNLNWFGLGDLAWQGNAAGIRFWLDNFRFIPVENGAPLKAQVVENTVSGVQKIAFVLDDKTETVPDTANAIAGTQLEVPGQGRRWLHLRVQNGAGVWSATNHIPLWLSGTAPRVSQVIPSDNTKAAPTQMTWQIDDDIALDPRSILLETSGQKYDVTHPALNYDNATSSLHWSVASASGLPPLQDGAKVEWKLSARDYAGLPLAPSAGNWVFDRAQDKTAPVLSLAGKDFAPVQWTDFEGGALVWKSADDVAVSVPTPGRRRRDVPETTKNDGENNSGATQIEIVTIEGDTSGNRVLKITALGKNSTMGVIARDQPWDATKANLVSFRYRIPKEANWSMRVRLKDGRAWNIRLKGEATDTLGAVSNISADDEWHWTQFDVLPFLKRDARANPTEIQGIDFIDPRQKTPPGTVIYLDDFSLIAPVKGAGKVQWQATDLSGVSKYRVAWDKEPNTIPSEETLETQRDLPAEPGTYFLHLQADDNAGNFSTTAHFPVTIK